MRYLKYIFILFFLSGCGTLSMTSLTETNQKIVIEDSQKIPVYLINTNREIQGQWFDNNAGADARRFVEMNTENDKRVTLFGNIISFGLLGSSYPDVVNHPPLLTRSAELELIQKASGEFVQYVDRTDEFKSETDFLNYAKTNFQYYIVYHVCDLTGIVQTDQYDAPNNLNSIAVYTFNVPTTAVRVNLYSSKKKILDFRKVYIAKRTKLISRSVSVFETREIIRERRNSEAVRKILEHIKR